VFSTAGSNPKRDFCVDLGAAAAFNYHTEDWAKETFNASGGGVDVVLDMVCGSYLQRNLDVLKAGGRLAVIGSQGGYSPGDDGLNLLRLMRDRLTISGSTLRPRSKQLKATIATELKAQVWPLLESGRVKVQVDSTFPLGRASDAHRRMETSEHIGKIALLCGQVGTV
jgi:NADPH2:quinone reductase